MTKAASKDSAILYLNIHQVLEAGARTAERRMPRAVEYERQLDVSMSRNHVGVDGEELSHVTLEYRNARAKFFTVVQFDGSGDYGTGLGSFYMPRVRLASWQRALIMLSVLKFLIDADLIDAEFEFFRERLSQEFDGGVGYLLEAYEVVVNNSTRHLENQSDMPVKITALDWERLAAAGAQFGK